MSHDCRNVYRQLPENYGQSQHQFYEELLTSLFDENST